jgi:single-strand DNA-binding protein
MNQIILTGRITNDLEIKLVNGDLKVLNFGIAVDREYKDSKGEKITDFFNVTVWRQGAEFLANYGHKGDVVGVVGSLQRRAYEQDGKTVYTVDVVAKSVELLQVKHDLVKDDLVQEAPKDELVSGDDLPF